MMAEMEKLDIQFLSETHIAAEEGVSKEEVWSPGKEEGGKVRNMETEKVGFHVPKCMDPREGASRQAWGCYTGAHPMKAFLSTLSKKGIPAEGIAVA